MAVLWGLAVSYERGTPVTAEASALRQVHCTASLLFLLKSPPHKLSTLEYERDQWSLCIFSSSLLSVQVLEGP